LCARLLSRFSQPGRAAKTLREIQTGHWLQIARLDFLIQRVYAAGEHARQHLLLSTSGGYGPT
jgi:hypothetical protein